MEVQDLESLELLDYLPVLAVEAADAEWFFDRRHVVPSPEASKNLSLQAGPIGMVVSRESASDLNDSAMILEKLALHRDPPSRGLRTGLNYRLD